MRTTRCVMCGLVVLMVTGTLQAQSKLSGKMQCAKPDPSYAVPVADKANHAMSLAGAKCLWSQGDIGGDPLKDENDTYVSDVIGNLSRDRGYGVGSVANGDQYFVRFDGTTTLKADVPVGARCTWTFTGGTGKLKGLTGKGTCKGTFNADGTASWVIQGEYHTPASSKAK